MGILRICFTQVFLGLILSSHAWSSGLYWQVPHVMSELRVEVEHQGTAPACVLAAFRDQSRATWRIERFVFRMPNSSLLKLRTADKILILGLFDCPGLQLPQKLRVVGVYNGDVIELPKTQNVGQSQYLNLEPSADGDLVVDNLTGAYEDFEAFFIEEGRSDAQKERVYQGVLEPQEHATLNLEKLLGLSRLQRGGQLIFTGSGRKLISYEQGVKQKQYAEVLLKDEVVLDPKDVFFLVGSKHDPKAPQYVLKLNRLDQVSEARRFLQSPLEQRPVVWAKIAPKAAKFNVDFQHPHKPLWSWHPSELMGFSSFGMQECDGNPQWVELFAYSWMESPGVICFWSYSLLRELDKSEF